MWDVTANSVAVSGPSSAAAAHVPTPRAFTGHTGRVRSVSYNAQQPHIFASGSDDGSLRVWDIRSPSGAAYSAELGSNVCGVAFSPWDENVLACGTAAHSVSVFDIRNCKAPLSQVQGTLATVYHYTYWVDDVLSELSLHSLIGLQGTCTAPAAGKLTNVHALKGWKRLWHMSGLCHVASSLQHQ
jgi:WD40 repeat protein